MPEEPRNYRSQRPISRATLDRSLRVHLSRLVAQNRRVLPEMFEPIKFRLKHPLTASTFACREVKGTPQEEAAAHEKHIPPVAVQAQHEQAARSNPE